MQAAQQHIPNQLNESRTIDAWVHTGLLWKEWHQHRYLLFLQALIILQPVIYPFIWSFFSSFNLIHPPSSFDQWVWLVHSTIDNGNSMVELTSMIVVVFLAAAMLTLERGGTLNYLASTAVNRRQILVAKWLTGSLSILGSMICLALYMYGIAVMHPPFISIPQILFWSLLATLALLALFSLALLSACIFSSFLYAVAFTGFFLALPMLLSSIVLNPLYKYSILSDLQVAQAYQWLYQFNIVELIIRENADTGFSLSFLTSILVLLLFNFLFLFLAVHIFEHSPLERSGEVLLAGNSKEIGRLLLTVLLAPSGAAQLAGTWQLFLPWLLIIALGIYLGMGILWQFAARLGLSKEWG